MKCTQEYYYGKIIGCGEDGNLFKGLVGFIIIVGLQKSIPYVIKSIRERRMAENRNY